MWHADVLWFSSLHVLGDAAFGAILGSLQVEEAARFETERAEELRKLQVCLYLGSFSLAAVQPAALRWPPDALHMQLALLTSHPLSEHFPLLPCTASCCHAARPPRAGEAEPCHHEDAHQAVKGGGGSCRGAVGSITSCCIHCLAFEKIKAAVCNGVCGRSCAVARWSDRTLVVNSMLLTLPLAILYCGRRCWRRSGGRLGPGRRGTS